jgi:hypothetical protein
MDDTCGARPGYSSGAYEFILDFSGVLVCSIFIFLYSVLPTIVCPFVLFLLLSVLRFTAFDYSFGSFQNFLFLIQDFRQEEKG